MVNVFSKSQWAKATAIVAGMALLSTTACSDSNEPAEAGGIGDNSTVLFSFKGMPAKGAPALETDILSGVSVYHFNGDDFFLRTDIEDPYAESIGLAANGTTRVHCVSGLDLNADAGMKEEAFLNLTASCNSGDGKAPMFYTGSIDFSPENLSNGRLEIEMKRGVARIDFANTIDTDIIINKVIVENAPASTYIISRGSMPGDKTVSFTREFSEPFYGEETGMFQIFESTRPVTVRIMGQYGRSPLNIPVTLPCVERNKVYTLQVANINSGVSGAFTCKEWQEGSATGAIPSVGRGLFIDRLNSVIPDGVEVEYGKNTVNVPCSGVKDMKLAFLSKTKVSVSLMEGEISTVRINVNDPVKVEEGYLSSFNISVAPNERLAYSLIIHIKDEEGRSNYVEINILENPVKKIETVEIAGRTWMAFNAVSADPAVQVFTVDGMSVEDTYKDRWPVAIGSFFQYGKALSYSPWTRNDPNGNSETPRDIPWCTPEAMPLPAGYHVASQSDWEALLPKGVTIPSTYAAGNGEQIKAELITLPGKLSGTPSASANKAGLLMRYLRFESQESGNVLIIPICGMKKNNTDEYPGGGKAMHVWAGYWIKEDRSLWLFQIGGTDDAPVVTPSASKWNYDGFMAVRGVKDL